MRTFFVGVSSWVIQDGNYGDFHVGQECRFALEFYPGPLQAVDPPDSEAAAEPLGGNRYRIRSRVVHVADSVWVIDLGVLAYDNHEPPSFAHTGGWVEGTCYLGIDPFFYFEELCALPGMPELRFDWRVKRIWRETSRWLRRVDSTGRTSLFRDERNPSFIEVSETNAWADDDGHADYVLECERIG